MPNLVFEYLIRRHLDKSDRVKKTNSVEYYHIQDPAKVKRIFSFKGKCCSVYMDESEDNQRTYQVVPVKLSINN